MNNTPIPVQSPAPWTPVIVHADSKVTLAIRDARGDYVASLPNRNSTNHRLLAAAPELRNALRTVLHGEASQAELLRAQQLLDQLEGK